MEINERKEVITRKNMKGKGTPTKLNPSPV
jgi:hypothetical protein